MIKNATKKLLLLGLFCLAKWIFFVGPVYGQSDESKLPHDLNFYFHNNVKIASSYEQLKKYNFEKLDSVNKWRYYFLSSSYRLYLGLDSSVYYLNKSLSLYPRKTCGALVRLDLLNKDLMKRGHRPKDYTWYLNDLPDFDENKFLLSCEEKYNSSGSKNQVNHIDSSLLGKLLRANDRKYRRNYKNVVDWGEQSNLDKKNRMIMDSVLLERKSLKHFSQFELNAFSFVIHHSSVDIDWTTKWLDIFFAAIENNEIKGATMLQPAMHRFFDPEKGIMLKSNPKKALFFLSQYFEKYPKTMKVMDLEWLKASMD